jgi:hypothetical protein
MLIVEIKVEMRNSEGHADYALWYQIFNIVVRSLKLLLDSIVLIMFLRLLSYFIGKKIEKLENQALDLSSYHKQVIGLTLVLTFINFYRCLYVCTIGIASQTSVDILQGFRAQLMIHKHILIPFIDYSTGMAFLYLFYQLDLKRQY